LNSKRIWLNLCQFDSNAKLHPWLECDYMGLNPGILQMVHGMVLGDVIASLSFTWRLPTWGWCWWASLLPAPSYNLQSSDEGIELLIWCCPGPLNHSGWWRLSEGVNRPGLNIWCNADRLGTCVNKSYIEKLIFIRACLSYVRVTMVIMCVFLVESLYQTVKIWISALKYVLSGACAFLWPRLITSGNKWGDWMPKSRREAEWADRSWNPACPRLS
jgi:hypothetical protein